MGCQDIRVFRDSIVKLVSTMILKIVEASKEKNSVEMQISSMLNH